MSPSSAAITRPMLVLLPIVTFLIPAIFVSLARTPTYTAEARLLVGGFDVEAQAVPGFVEAARTLAETYARLVETEVIAAPVAEALDVDVEAVQGHIEASSVPESSIIRVKGKASDDESAVAFAEAASIALEDYAAGDRIGSEDLLDDYEEAVVEQKAAERELARLRTAAGSSPSSESIAVLAQAEATAERARLRAEALRESYAATGGRSGSAVQLIGQAASTGSDRTSSLLFSIGATVLLGFIAGMALVTVVVNREVAARREVAAINLP